jgi:hypothetical protein
MPITDDCLAGTSDTNLLGAAASLVGDLAMSEKIKLVHSDTRSQIKTLAAPQQFLLRKE